MTNADFEFSVDGYANVDDFAFRNPHYLVSDFDNLRWDFEEPIGGGWILVRHVPAGDTWYTHDVFCVCIWAIYFF